MVASPRTPSTIFWGLGALTIGSKIAGSTMSALEAAGDLEGHRGLGLQLVDLTDRHLELLELLLARGDLGGKSPPLVGEQQPVGGDPDDRDHVDEAEEHAQVEARQPERGEAGEAEAPPPLRLGREIDPDHSSLSPGRLSPSPTATASAGPAALTSSP